MKYRNYSNGIQKGNGYFGSLPCPACFELRSQKSKKALGELPLTLKLAYWNKSTELTCLEILKNSCEVEMVQVFTQ